VHLNEEEMIIVDVQPNIHDYIAEHIPGAIYIPEGVLRSHRGHLPCEFVAEEAIEPVFRQAGLKKGIPIVVYTGTSVFKGWGDGLEQTMMAYSMVRFDLDTVYVLDGGLDKWKAEGKSLSQEFPTAMESDFNAVMEPDFRIDYETFKAVKDKSNVILVDARPPEVYRGKGPWRKPGHIPGAINIPWPSFMDTRNRSLLKPHEEILRIIEKIGIGRDNMVIWYCGTGREAINPFILFKWYFDYPDVKIYEGSFTEWTAYPGNPTVTGPDPR
jgi:thiosulfate/3-mercaptopyruvate sulfurtransferase